MNHQSSLFAYATLPLLIHSKQRWRREYKARGQEHKKIRGQGQGQSFLGKTLSRLSTEMLQTKVKDQVHNAQVFSKKKKQFLRKNCKFLD